MKFDYCHRLAEVLKKKSKTKKSIVITVGFIVLAVLTVVFLYAKQQAEIESEPIDDIGSFIDHVSDDELAYYRDTLGSDMDIKKAIFVIFNTFAECEEFIEAYGDREDILTLGIGILPMMSDDGSYYNVVGNPILEPIFDSLKDGEYVKEPVQFGDMWCYFKRVQLYSLTSDDEALREFIQQERARQAKYKEQE